MKRVISFFLAALLAVSLPGSVGAEQPRVPFGGPFSGVSASALAPPLASASAEGHPWDKAVPTLAPYDDDEMVTVIVELEGTPLAQQAGAQSGVSRYAASAIGGKAQNALIQAQKRVKSAILAQNPIKMQAASETFSSDYHYTAVLNGFSMTMPYGKVAAARKISGVKQITIAQTFAKPEIQAGQAGPAALAETSGLSYTGTGTIIAILDTGIDTRHEAFANWPSGAKYTQSQMHALVNRKGLASRVSDGFSAYVSGKIPYAFDYADNDTDVTDSDGHGTHVAGIAAGHSQALTGVAPDAQLMIMKVFSSKTGSVNEEDILAALDDAVKLGADSVNLSLGSPSGYADTRETALNNAYKICNAAGISLAASIGNDGQSGNANAFGNDLPAANAPDSALVCYPATSFAALSVASVQSPYVAGQWFVQNGAAVSYANPSIDGEPLSPVNQLTKNADPAAYEYVAVPGLGAASDYAGLKLAGKIALVARGTITFSEKAAFAKAAGAVGIIVYNNVPGTFYPGLSEDTLPLFGITQQDGEAMLAAQNKKITFSRSYDGLYPAKDAGTPSVFSGWGPAPNLTIKPEIAAPGGNVFSALPGGAYDLRDGTSMAAPHVAGASALVREYLAKNFGFSPIKYRAAPDAILMGTAKPAVNPANGSEYSPRQQGAGVLNLAGALSAKAYPSVAGSDRPKAELGANTSGVYYFNVTVQNLSNEAITYGLSLSSLTEGVVEEEGRAFIDLISTRLTEGRDYTVSFGGTPGFDGKTLTVPANGQATVAVRLALTESRKAAIEQSFPNGYYVEGYLYMTPETPNGGATLSVPYLGFYGDWDAGPLFDEVSEDYFLTPTFLYSMGEEGFGFALGFDFDDTFNLSKMAFSPLVNALEWKERVLNIGLSLRRNASDLRFSVQNPEGRTIWSYEEEFFPKSFYADEYGLVQIYSPEESWDGRDPDNIFMGIHPFLPGGRFYTYTVSGRTAQTGKEQTLSIPFFLDTQWPRATDFSVAMENGVYTLNFTATDNHYVHSVAICDAENGVPLLVTGEEFAAVTKMGAANRVSIDITGLGRMAAYAGLDPGKFTVYVYDYAGNYSKSQVVIGPSEMYVTDAFVEVGETADIQRTTVPGGTGEFPVTWRSSNPAVARVNANGSVTGIRNGTAVITATARSGLMATCTVTVGTGLPDGPCQGGADCPSHGFSDLSPAAWYHGAVDFALAGELMNGVGGGKFDPNGTATRAMFVTMLYRLAGSPAVAGNLPFTDVVPGAWYADAVAWAWQNEITNGTSATRFGVQDPVTRQQAAVFLMRYAVIDGRDISGRAPLSGFGDTASIASWATDAMAWAVDAGILGGNNGRLMPGDNAQRSQVAAIFQRYVENPS